MGYSLVEDTGRTVSYELIKRYKYNVTEASAEVYFTDRRKLMSWKNWAKAELRDDNVAVYLTFKNGDFAVVENPIQEEKIK